MASPEDAQKSIVLILTCRHGELFDIGKSVNCHFVLSALFSDCSRLRATSEGARKFVGFKGSYGLFQHEETHLLQDQYIRRIKTFANHSRRQYIPIFHAVSKVFRRQSVTALEPRAFAMMLRQFQEIFYSQPVHLSLVAILVAVAAATTRNDGEDCLPSVPSWQLLQGEANPFCMVNMIHDNF